MKARPILFGFFAFIFLFMASFGIWVQSTGALLGFGGMVYWVVPCPCSGGNFAVSVGPPSPGIYSYIPYATQTHLNGPPYRPGQYVLGSYAPGGVCLTVGTPCAPVHVMGTMYTVGTSL
mgnify:FL=1